jgi:hypothetical protein
MSPQNILYLTWAGIFVIGFIIIAIRKSARTSPSKDLPTFRPPLPPRAPREIDLAREVQRIRQTLFGIWWLIFFLGIFIMWSWPRGFVMSPITP